MHVRIRMDATRATHVTGVNALVELPDGIDPNDHDQVARYLEDNPDAWSDAFHQSGTANEDTMSVFIEDTRVVA